jgi:hypothetical protein
MGNWRYYVIVNCKNWGISVLEADGSIFVRYMRMKRIVLVLLGVLLIGTVFSQKEMAMPSVPQVRLLHHENIINALNSLAKLQVTRNDTLNRSINRTVRVTVNNMRAGIELNNTLDNNGKFKWLRGIHEMLTSFISGYNARVIKGMLLPSLVKAYDDAMRIDLSGRSIAGVIADHEPEIGNILVENYALKENKGIPEAGMCWC